MAVKQHLGFLYLFTLAFTTMSLCTDEELYVIRSAVDKSLVLDSTDPSGEIKIQNFTGYSPQLWKFETGSKVGLFYIVNNATGDPLDFVTSDENLKLVTARRRNIKRQQWYLTLKGRIVNADNGENIDLGARFLPGNSLILYRDNNKPAQEFVWEKFYLTGLLIRIERAVSTL